MSYSAKRANPSRHNLVSCMSLVACTVRGLRMGLSTRDSPYSAVVLALVTVCTQGALGVLIARGKT